MRWTGHLAMLAVLASGAHDAHGEEADARVVSIWPPALPTFAVEPADDPEPRFVLANQNDAPVKLEDLPKLTVRGEAELHKPADRLRLSLGVVTEAVEAPAALRENSRRMQDVVKAIVKVGLAESEYQTGRFSVAPIYSRRPRNAPAEWRPQIVEYRVTNTLTIKTKKLALAGELIQAANEAGANSIDSISFDLADPRTHRREAIAAATANALADAEVLADSASVRLVRVVALSLDSVGRQPIMSRAHAAGPALADAAGVPPPITPGDVTVRAGVTVVYEIDGR